MSERAQKERAERIKQYNDHVRLGFEEALLQPNGRAMLWWLLEKCRFAGLSIDVNDPGNTHRTAMHEGQRLVGLEILGQCLSVHPSSYLKMQQEHQQRMTPRVGAVVNTGGEDGDGE